MTKGDYIHINPKKALKRLNNLEKEITAKGQMTVTELSSVGKNFAKAIVYYDTGFTYKSIKRRVVPRATGSSAIIYIEPLMRPVDGVLRRTPGNYPSFSLVRWSHTSPKARDHFRRGGDPMFMYTTNEYLGSIKGNTARRNFSLINV